MKPETRWLCIAIASVIGLIALLFSIRVSPAFASDYGQWDRSDPIVKWYKELMQPDSPAVSCCGEADAYWADSYEVNKETGEYIAIVTDTRDDAPLKRQHVDVGSRFLIPNYKIKWNEYDPQPRINVNPTGHGIIFLSANGFIYCYVAPGGV